MAVCNYFGNYYWFYCEVLIPVLVSGFLLQITELVQVGKDFQE